MSRKASNPRTRLGLGAKFMLLLAFYSTSGVVVLFPTPASPLELGCPGPKLAGMEINPTTRDLTINAGETRHVQFDASIGIDG